MRAHRYFLPVLAILLAAAPASAQSGTIRDDHAGCLTRELLDELGSAAARRDIRQIEHLLGNGCFNLRGREYSVVDRGFLRSTIRVYAGNSSVVLWVVTDAIR